MPSCRFWLGFLSHSLDCFALLAMTDRVVDSSQALKKILHAIPRNVRGAVAGGIPFSEAVDGLVPSKLSDKAPRLKTKRATKRERERRGASIFGVRARCKFIFPRLEVMSE
jgi:hypothetical protein